ncbi:MAG TPA: cytochrome c-type biogenesis CcmF C-terminal domain-containing protein, partial [Ardenticatenaceae bacterium]|nr:cytochrome c-type biogenesis CcmF C-terminal domain-containing protein [Ardenticatenaceae bacterium]
MFTVFMVIILAVSFGLVIFRLPLLRARHELDSWVSREAAFLANNWILLFSAFFVLFATMFPTLSEAVTGERLTVGPPFFNKWMLPIGLMLLLLTGVGPLLAWRKSSVSNLVHQFLWPTTAAVATGALLAFLGVRVWSSGICFALCAFVTVTIGQEFVRGAFVRKGATGTDILTAMIGLVARSQRRYGGYIVHVGIVLVFLGFAGQGFKQEEQALLKPGQEIKVGNFSVRHDALRVTSDRQKQMVTGHVTVREGGEVVDELRPARWFFVTHQDEPTTEVAIRRTPAEDLYVVLASYDAATQSATYAVTVNPLVNWIWVGFGVIALGTGLALLPETAFAFAASKVPAGVPATTSLMLLGLLISAGAAQAQTNNTGQVVPRSALERQLEGEIQCTCGCRRALNNCGMPNCGGHESQTARLRQLLSEGKDHDTIIATFVREFGGQDVLSSPVDEGFNRLAWLFPYLLGASGAVMVAFAAVKWSRLPDGRASSAADSAPVEDAALQSKLDDELRDLD